MANTERVYRIMWSIVLGEDETPFKRISNVLKQHSYTSHTQRICSMQPHHASQ